MNREALAAAADAEARYWERQLSDDLLRLFDRQEAVVLARLTGTKARKNTRHWEPAGERKIDPSYVLDPARWVLDAASVVAPTLRRLWTSVFTKITGNLTGAPPADNPEAADLPADAADLIEDAITRRIALVNEGVMTAATEVQVAIRQADDEGLPMDDVAERVRALYAARRANWSKRMTTVNVMGSINEAGLIAAVRAGSARKQWISYRDDKVRSTHSYVDGDEVLITTPFRLGGPGVHPDGRVSLLQFPGDPTAPLDEIMNCRCTLLFSRPPATGTTVLGNLSGVYPLTKSADAVEETKIVRRVRTPEGAAEYGQPIGSVIKPDGPKHAAPGMPKFSSGHGGAHSADKPKAPGHKRAEAVKNIVKFSGAKPADAERALDVALAIRKGTSVDVERLAADAKVPLPVAKSTIKAMGFQPWTKPKIVAPAAPKAGPFPWSKPGESSSWGYGGGKVGDGTPPPPKPKPKPVLDAPVGDYGMTYTEGNEKAPQVRAARKFDGWKDLPLQDVPLEDLRATEEMLQGAVIKKVVAQGKDALRKGYDPQVLIDGDGTWIIDGHHRVAMHSGLGNTTMKAHVLDARGTTVEAVVDKRNIAAAEKIADKMVSRAEEADKTVTPLIADLVDGNGGYMEGLEHRVKTRESTARKIMTRARMKRTSPQGAASGVGDVLRYTAVLPTDSYTDGAKETLAALKAEGYSVTVNNNYWAKGDAYSGMNVLLSGPGGGIEVQFHTPESFAAKDAAHDDYEVSRDLDAPMPERMAAWERMVALWDDVPQPPAWQSMGSLFVYDPPGGGRGRYINADSPEAQA